MLVLGSPKYLDRGDAGDEKEIDNDINSLKSNLNYSSDFVLRNIKSYENIREEIKKNPEILNLVFDEVCQEYNDIFTIVADKDSIIDNKNSSVKVNSKINLNNSVNKSVVVETSAFCKNSIKAAIENNKKPQKTTLIFLLSQKSILNYYTY